MTAMAPAASSSVEPVLRVRDLRRHFDGVRAVDGVSFDIPRGTVLGFVGANGAGKTTTMRLISTLDTPDAGTIEIEGVDVVEKPARVRPRIGWMPDHTGLYDLTTALDYLDFFARAHGLRGRARSDRLHEVIEFTGLERLTDRPMRGLSKGETQRLALARTLLHDPTLLILDEPAAGLDPKARIEFRNLVALLRGQGKTVLISSHILSELGEMCDSLLFIDAGRIVHHGTAESLRRTHETGARVVVTVAGAVEPLHEWLQVHPGWQVVGALRNGARADFTSADPAALSGELRRMVLDGIDVAGFAVEERRLEDAFIDILRKVSNAEAPTNSTPADVASSNPPPLP